MARNTSKTETSWGGLFSFSVLKLKPRNHIEHSCIVAVSFAWAIYLFFCRNCEGMMQIVKALKRSAGQDAQIYIYVVCIQ